MNIFRCPDCNYESIETEFLKKTKIMLICPICQSKNPMIILREAEKTQHEKEMEYRKAVKEIKCPPRQKKGHIEVKIFYNSVDVSDEVEITNRKSNPFGWSQSELWHNGKQIGWIESGYFDFINSDYTYVEEFIEE